MSEVGRNLRGVLDAGLTWALLAYGIFMAAVESVREREDVLIAFGVESILVALIGFLWAGRRRSLGWALVVVGVAAPVIMFSTAPLYWDDPIAGEVFVLGAALGAAVGLPLGGLGWYLLTRARPPRPRADPWWFTPARWLVQGGLLTVALAFRNGGWDEGIPLVYVGGALALVALLVALPRRIAITRRGLGLFLIILGGGALVVIGVAAAGVGGHMSTDEAAVGLLPAAAVLAVGAVLALSGPAPTRVLPPAAGPAEEPGPDVEHAGLEGTVIDMLGGGPRSELP